MAGTRAERRRQQGAVSKRQTQTSTTAAEASTSTGVEFGNLTSTLGSISTEESGDIQAFIDAVSEKRKQGDTEGPAQI
ncbi:hypothetical protein OS493_029294 [Desmophyllum pertusum]|uniref:Uncharacterized protein n=1 Tax=Desmophyllum pertusum TaxID=174260 RepID=A0A9X0CVT0_9CNID|nr:hypothetical protein OS493_029294 [Desmophyllum pertusum]